MVISPFHRARCAYQPRYPRPLGRLSDLAVERHRPAEPAVDEGQKRELKRLFPLTWGQGLLDLNYDGDTRLAPGRFTVAVVLSGGPAPGGHNVVWGLLDGLKSLSPDARVIGFRSGPAGIVDDKHVEITPESLAEFKNTGGFDLLGTGRAKIETPEQFARCRAVLERHGADVLAIIGGDDSNTNAALLAEYFLAHGCKTRVIGVPKTIDGDLKNRYVEISFGYDTAVRLYSELVANIARDALSARKYYHFIRLMGRSASHITLEVALQTQPNMALISEEVAAGAQTLADVVARIGECIKARARAGKNYGVVLVPEGLIEFIPEVKALIRELNEILAGHRDYVQTLSGFTAQSEFVHRKLSRDASHVFASMPIDIQRQLLMDRDPHGNVQVSRIETEKLLIGLLQSHLKEEQAEGRYTGKFSYQHHFLGYEGRCACPTNFDADYAYALGRTAVALIAAGVTGYMAVVTGLAGDPAEWQAQGVPLLAMMNLETRHGKQTPVIRKSLVDLDGRAFRYFAARRQGWSERDDYRFSGPIQYFGPPAMTDKVPLSLALERGVETEIPW
jgi:pyrophosphate--fructose-6-phosphate 1-phosphotransferase